MKVEAWGKTDVGLKRSENQDSIYLDTDLGLYIVADGMGGHQGGGVASLLAIETVVEIITTKKDKLNAIFTPIELFREAYIEATRRIFEKGNTESPELRGMGTTLVVAIVYDGSVFVGNVGDSRAYLFNGKNMWQITEDHSLVYEQLKMSKFRNINEDQLLGKNIITRSVGFEPSIQVDIVQKKIKAGDCLFLCSDGVTGPVTNDQLLELFSTAEGSQIPDKCIELACQGGGDDNISAVYIKFS